MLGILMRYAWLFAVLALAHAAHAQERYPSRLSFDPLNGFEPITLVTQQRLT
jgi:hypothetical protein